MEESEFDDLMQNKYLPKFEEYLNWFESGFYKDNFLKALDEYLRPTMQRRAEDYGDDFIFSTMSHGDYSHLEEIIDQEDDFEEQKKALLNIIYRYFYWSWGYEENGNTESWIELQHKQILDLVESYV